MDDINVFWVLKLYVINLLISLAWGLSVDTSDRALAARLILAPPAITLLLCIGKLLEVI